MNLFNKVAMTVSFFAVLLLSACPTRAQRSHGRVQGPVVNRPSRVEQPRRPESPREQPRQPVRNPGIPDEPRGRDQRPKYSGENHTHRFHRDHDRDVRYYPDGRQGFCYGGVWFVAIYPEWAFVDEVYFVELAPGEWVVVDFYNPALSAFVEIEN